MNDASSPPPREPSDPFVQLQRSHRRLEEACAALGAAITGRDIETVNDVASFFARQVRRHEEDEDGSLFPRLIGRAELTDVLARLTA